MLFGDQGKLVTRLGTEVTRVDWEEGRVTTTVGDMIVG